MKRSSALLVHRFRFLLPALLSFALGVVLASEGAWSASPQQAWVAAWAASPHAVDADPNDPLLNIDGQTVRQRARLSVRATSLRIRLSNECGSAPLTIGAASVALSDGVAAVKAESLKPLTFGGRNSVTLPAGAPILSDIVDLAAPAGAELSVSLYFPTRITTPTIHGLALKSAVISARGDFTRAARVEAKGNSQSSISMTAVLVPAQPGQKLVVAFGDSITDGDGSSVDADKNWPSAFARRLLTRKGGVPIAIVNAGIAGNRLLSDGFAIKALGSSALTRFDRDVLAVPGVTHVVVLEGVNDIGFPGATLGGQALADASQTRAVEDLIGAYQQLIARAHARGLKIAGGTITPFAGVDFPGYYSDAKEAARQRVNTWIRTSGAFDAVIDFDAVLRDPVHPNRMLTRYASPDHLHPSDIGYQAMADAIDPSLFE